MGNKIYSISSAKSERFSPGESTYTYLELDRVCSPRAISAESIDDYLAYLGAKSKDGQLSTVVSPEGEKYLLAKKPIKDFTAAVMRAKHAAKYGIAAAKDVAAVKSAMHNIFHWNHGERILLPEFGTRLRELLYEGLTDSNREQVAAEVRHAVTNWEPRVQIDSIADVTSVQDREENTVHLIVIYSIPSLTGTQQYNVSIEV